MPPLFFLYLADGTEANNVNGVSDSTDQQLLNKQEGALRTRQEEAEKIVGLER